METPPPFPQKKGLGPLAWTGIGCGSLLLIGIVALAVLASVFAPKVKKFARDAQTFAEAAEKNPTRAMAEMMVKFSAGTIEMVAEDEANLRYTVRVKTDGKLTTIYWDEKKQEPAVVEGDFSAIPAASEAPAEPEPAAPAQ